MSVRFSITLSLHLLTLALPKLQGELVDAIIAKDLTVRLRRSHIRKLHFRVITGCRIFGAQPL